jgi:hypothetical protein
MRAPVGTGEIRRIERLLATARVMLAISAIVAILMDPAEIRPSLWASGLLTFWCCCAAGNNPLSRFDYSCTRRM